MILLYHIFLFLYICFIKENGQIIRFSERISLSVIEFEENFRMIGSFSC